MIQTRKVLDWHSGLPKEVYDDIGKVQQDFRCHQDSFVDFDAVEFEDEYPHLSKYIRDAGETKVLLLIWW